MVDAVKNYGLTGVAKTVELGKKGNKIDATTSSSKISLRNNSDALVKAEIGEGTASSHAVTKSQLDGISSKAISISEHTVNFDDSSPVTLCTLTAGSRVLSVTMEKGAGNWTDASATTNITVGDAADVDRLFTSFDYAGIQVIDETDHTYSSQTAIIATITRGGASAGTATILIRYAGALA
mgnify:CR=1 FL=1|tara:strand:+ start:632 stop:1174 length:543 start_codon:yes stop_codon:yes gene_type:complete